MDPKGKLISFGMGLLAALIMISFNIFGPFTFLLAYFIPLIFFSASLFYGIKGILISAGLSALIMFTFYGITISSEFIFINACPAIWLSYRSTYFKMKYSLDKFLSEISIVGVFLYLFFSFFFVEKLTVFKNSFENIMNLNFSTAIDIPNQIIGLFPSIIIATWITILFINLSIAKKISTKYKIQINNYNHKFSHIFLPKVLIYLFLTFLMLSILFIDNYNILFQSISVILSIPITLQGLASTHSLFKKFSVNNFLTSIFYLIVIFIPFTLAIITAIGVLDHFYNFRKLKL